MLLFVDKLSNVTREKRSNEHAVSDTEQEIRN